MNTRYPRIREAYGEAALVRVFDRLDALARSGDSDSLIHGVLVRYLDVIEATLGDPSRGAGAADALLRRAIDGVQQALDAFGLLEAEPDRLLN